MSEAMNEAMNEQALENLKAQVTKMAKGLQSEDDLNDHRASRQDDSRGGSGG